MCVAVIGDKNTTTAQIMDTTPESKSAKTPSSSTIKKLLKLKHKKTPKISLASIAKLKGKAANAKKKTSRKLKVNKGVRREQQRRSGKKKRGSIVPASSHEPIVPVPDLNRAATQAGNMQTPWNASHKNAAFAAHTGSLKPPPQRYQQPSIEKDNNSKDVDQKLSSMETLLDILGEHAVRGIRKEDIVDLSDPSYQISSETLQEIHYMSSNGTNRRALDTVTDMYLSFNHSFVIFLNVFHPLH